MLSLLRDSLPYLSAMYLLSLRPNIYGIYPLGQSGTSPFILSTVGMLSSLTAIRYIISTYVLLPLPIPVYSVSAHVAIPSSHHGGRNTFGGPVTMNNMRDSRSLPGMGFPKIFLITFEYPLDGSIVSMWAYSWTMITLSQSSFSPIVISIDGGTT